MALLDRVPPWVLRPLPVNASTDEPLHDRLDDLATRLPITLPDMHAVLAAISTFREYDAAANRASAHVWLVIDQFYSTAAPRHQLALLEFAATHMVPEAQAR